MRDNIFKLLFYSILISHANAQFDPLGLIGTLGSQLGNLPVLSNVFALSCRADGRLNEVFSSCGNNACQNTCRNPTVTSGCSGACVAGCICASGYLRNSQNRCVLPQNCDVGPTVITQTCAGANEVYSTCGDNGCQPTCSNLNIGFCNPSCGTPRCICATGYVRNNLGSCILPINCPASTTCSRPNEIYSQCGNDGCQMTCSRLDVTSCVRVCSIPGCICAAGFVRNSAGDCVLPSSCPTTGSTCTGMNEVFSTCGNDGCQRSCSRLIVNDCVPVCGTAACICAPGFVRNNGGFCVLPLSCPITSCLGANELFSLCGNDGCQRSCTRQEVIACNPVCSLPGCICVPGFVRNSLGLCVQPSSCPTITCTRPNEVPSNCGDDGCQRTCTRLDVSTCVRTCNPPACVCAPGYVRDASLNCILPSSCPIPVCTKQNEISSLCGNDGCQRSCTRLDVTGCTQSCSAPGCICAIGFVRNNAGDCVLPSSCPAVTCTGSNEVFSACGNDGCQKTCDRLDTTGCTRVCTISACVCLPGYVRNIAGNCVLPETCPSVTCNGAFEVFSACGNDGCQRTCSRLDTTGCRPVCTTSGCICAPGYVKNSAGVCVTPQSCPSTTCNPGTEVFSACGNDGCQRTCDRLEIAGCSPVCVQSGCICAQGLVRNSMGQCVPPSSCPAITCPANEMFSTCANDGCQATCTRQDTSGCTRVCVASGCICAPGLVRNSAGTCVAPQNCPTITCDNPNEMFSPCGNDGCQKSCSRLEVTGCKGVCFASGCICKVGFVRNSMGACVAPSSCPAVTCPANEMFSLCSDDGCVRSCARLETTGCTKQCVASGCVCASGLIRNAAGVCVPPSSCPVMTCPGVNEMFSACGDDGCQKTCTRLEVTGCNPVCKASGCICLPGYVRDNRGICVMSTSCVTPVCPNSNEVYSACGEDGCQKKCTRLDVSGCTRVCTTSGCICMPGLVRNSEGNCVPATSCPALVCNGMFEMASSCGDDGCQRSCSRLDVTGCNPVCSTSGCVCSPGYVRNSQGVCVASCPSVTCSGQNEVFSTCGNDGCQKTCSRMDVTGCTRKCTTSGCICAVGFVRNLMGFCVAPSACPAVTCTAQNEMYSQCGNDGCQRSCTRLDTTGCTPVCTESGCICKTGYVRNSAGVCILPSTCPTVTCSRPNEEFSACGDDGCQLTCSRPVVTGCTRVCTNSGCVCKRGFYKDAAGNCVSQSSCPSLSCTGTNEEPSDCADSGCQATCRRQSTAGCSPVCMGRGCVCIANHVRNDAGNCIPSSTCPTIACTAPNEVFSPCGDDGCQKSCTRLDTTGCTSVCQQSGCVCSGNNVRNARGECVDPATMCTRPTCGTNEQFSECGDDGCQASCLRRLTTGCVPVCKASGCICIAGKIRNTAGDCVDATTCPEEACPANEVFSTCGEHKCLRKCETTTPTPCPTVCVASGCVCASTHYRNYAGVCTLIASCPTCGDNQVLSVCSNTPCQRRCGSLNPTCTCDTTVACVCRSGYVLDSTDVCINPNSCPAP